MHYHICRLCQHVWGHDRGLWDHRQRHAEHTCPNCKGAACTTKWETEDAARAALAGPVTVREVENLRDEIAKDGCRHFIAKLYRGCEPLKEAA